MTSPAWSIAMVAPAKLTLTLRVLGTRPDGFHALEALTVMVSAPADRIAVEGESGPGIRLVVTGADAGVPTGDDNLVVRAARALLPPEDGLRLTLTKVTPVGGGLGGGSADAAAVLRALRMRYRSDAATVAAAAAELGSDVPVCLHGGPVLMRGRGEVLDPVRLTEDLHVAIATPGWPVPTPAVFRAWDELAGTGRTRTAEAPPAVAHLVAELGNDLEPAAERVEPRLAGFRDAVARVAGTAPMLAGSGSSYWVPCADAEIAAGVAARVRDELGVTTFAGRVLRDAPG
jgi:4-diphosphocytidyl-2-C-methyl-D-erythritol kinase